MYLEDKNGTRLAVGDRVKVDPIDDLHGSSPLSKRSMIRTILSINGESRRVIVRVGYLDEEWDPQIVRAGF